MSDRELGDALEELPQAIVVFGGHLGKFHADTEAGAAVHHRAIEPQFLLPDPKPDLDFDSPAQRHRHFDEAASGAQVERLHPDGGCLPFGMKLDGARALQAGMQAAIGPGGLAFVNINTVSGHGQVPHGLLRRHVHEPKLAGERRPWQPGPLHFEAASVLFVGQSYDFSGFDLGLHAAHACAAAADVEGRDIFREHVAGGIGAEDADGQAGLQTRFLALTHLDAAE